MNRGEAKSVRANVEEALSALGNDLGITFKLGTIRFDSNGFRARLEGAEVRDGVVQTPERVAFVQQAKLYGFESDDLDKTFKHDGQSYKIVGLRTRGNVKRRVVTQRESDGATIFFLAESVTLALHAEAAAD